ncbi:carboxymuconolactone decarboxylase family protein [Rhodococcus triatomae]|nr:hypothetical protein G419_18170 [Rhodococcus triatomae BKS 15-14]
MAILLTARYWDCHFLFAMHRTLAVKHGIRPGDIDSVAFGERPDLSGGLGETYRFVAQLLRCGDVDDDTFAPVAKRWGQQGAVELIATVGFYSMLAMVLNVDRHPVPTTGQLLPDLDR